MSDKGNFRIRSHQSTRLTRGNSFQSEHESWFDSFKQKKLNCRKALQTHYGSISVQQALLRNVIKGTSTAAELEKDKSKDEECHSNQQEQLLLNNPEVKKQTSQSIRAKLRALTYQRAEQELVPTKINNFSLNNNLVNKSNDTIWNKLSSNSRQKQLLLFKAHDLTFGDVRGCCFKVSKYNKLYIVKVFNLQQKHGMVVGKETWYNIWQSHHFSYEEIMRDVQLLPNEKMIIKNSETQKKDPEKDHPKEQH